MIVYNTYLATPTLECVGVYFSATGSYKVINGST